MGPNAGGGCCGVLSDEYSCAHEAQINFGDLTPYLTYSGNNLLFCPVVPCLLTYRVQYVTATTLLRVEGGGLMLISFNFLSNAD